MKFHNSCRTLSIYSFNEILKNQDFRFLIKEYDEYRDDNIKLVVDEEIEASMIFKEIIYEYLELTLNKSLLQNYNSQLGIEKEEFRYNLTEKILSFYSESNDLDILNILNNLGWSLDDSSEINQQIEKIVSSMRRLKTKIDILKLKHKEKFKSNEINKEENDFSDKLDFEAISLEIALKISYSINTKETSVSKWISMWNVAGKINKIKT